MRVLYLVVLVEMARLHEERGDVGAAIKALQEVVATEPTHEGAQASLMRLYTLSGQRYQALRQYKRLVQTLGRELDTESRRLYEEILAGRTPTAIDPLPGGGEPAELPSAADRHNLPDALSSFVGREREVVEVERLLDAVRLLTLTGVGGSGKTRLALEVARHLVGAYPAGVWLVELAPLSEGALVPQAVVAALGIRKQPNRALISTLVNVLREQKVLLVLDNCEYLIGATAHLAEALLRSCPRLRIVATSREMLGATGEVSWLTPPLSGPDLQQQPLVKDLEGYESARLFVVRAQYRDPSFVLTPRNVQAVAQICRRMNGIPLAIEFAAARIGELSVEQIATRLGDSLRLLTTGSRIATPRHRTLRGTLDWSYELLTEPERGLFRRLSVFAGGWTLEAAEAVCSGNGIDEEDVSALQSRLVDKSLVASGASPEAGGELRYRMLEPVRQYGQEKREASGEAETIRYGHAEHYLALAETAEPELGGRNQPEWLDRLEAEHDNLRTALGWSLQQPEVEPPLRLAADLALFWHTHGHLSEGRAWLERTISASSATTDSHTRAKALNGAGWIAMFQGEYEAARALLEKALALFRELEDEDGVVTSITNLGLVAVLGERQDIPVPALLREAMGLRSKLTNPRTVASLLILSGLVSFAQGDAERAWESHEESLAICRETGNAGGMIVCLTNLGLMAVGRADKARALALLEGETNLTQTPDIIESDPAWSPDGSRIAFVVGTVQQENASIWAMNADGSEQTQITDGPFDFAPNWSPDGTKIVFDGFREVSDGSGGREITVVNADGSGRMALTTGGLANSGGHPSWSPDGAKFTFIGPGDGGSDVWVMNADGTAKARINPGAGSVEAQPDWQSLVGNPGTLQFDPATYAVGEAAGTSTITVTRTNGSGGAISVDYASSDGTASAASDYTAASGTLDFAAGQASTTFTVPILNDAGNEPDETVNLTLSNPTGGATLGGQSTVVLTITDDDPPNQAPTVAVARGGTCGASDMRGTINLAVADPDDSPQNLTLSATSSDQSVVPDGNISFAGGTDASRTLTVAAIRGSDTSTVTVTVSDGDLEASVPVKVGVGSDANNTLTGSAEADMIFARRGNDTASGQGANDLLCGSNSKDKLGGGEGDDTLRGAATTTS